MPNKLKSSKPNRSVYFKKLLLRLKESAKKLRRRKRELNGRDSRLKRHSVYWKRPELRKPSSSESANSRSSLPKSRPKLRKQLELLSRRDLKRRPLNRSD